MRKLHLSKNKNGFSAIPSVWDSRPAKKEKTGKGIIHNRLSFEMNACLRYNQNREFMILCIPTDSM